MENPSKWAVGRTVGSRPAWETQTDRSERRKTKERVSQRPNFFRLDTRRYKETSVITVRQSGIGTTTNQREVTQKWRI